MTATSGLRRSFPSVRYLAAPFRWAVRTRRRALTVAAVLLAMLAAPPLWWWMQLFGLPDIGVPFDQQAFRSLTIPDDRNAFVLYRQAWGRLEPLDRALESSGARVLGGLPIASDKLRLEAEGGSTDEKVDLLAPWSKADPRIRRWAEENREALELYRQGAERPDAFNPERNGPVNPRTQFEWPALRSFHLLALLEASRLEERGEMDGAWGWYRTALRASHHFGLRGTGTPRSVAVSWRGEILTRLTDWSSDQRTTPAMLRRALDDVLACGKLAPSDGYTIRATYPDVMRMLDRSWYPGNNLIKWLHDPFDSPGYRLNPEQVRAIGHAWRFVRREPERSRRVIRLATANWLACYDLPPEHRPKPDPKVPGFLRFYAVGPDAPASARALSPEALDRWLVTAIDAGPLLAEWNLAGIRMREARSYRALVVQLASELYRRDHGSLPLWDEALVGPYLKSLPDDGTGSDGTNPTAGEAPAVRGTAGRE